MARERPCEQDRRRLAAIQEYASGFPVGVVTNAPLPIFNGINRPNVTGADWRAPISGDKFDPRVDPFLNRAAFVQPVGALGNAPRMNVFNLFNRVVFSTPQTTDSFRNFTSQTFGIITDQSNNPRRMQLGVKLYW